MAACAPSVFNTRFHPEACASFFSRVNYRGSVILRGCNGSASLGNLTRKLPSSRSAAPLWHPVVRHGGPTDTRLRSAVAKPERGGDLADTIRLQCMEIWL